MQQALELQRQAPAVPSVELVTVSEAARRLGINKSTVSRQVGKLYRDHGTGDRPLLDMREVERARAEHLNPMMRRSGEPVDMPLVHTTSPAPASEANPAGGAGGITAGNARTRAEWDLVSAKAKALEATASVEERLGNLVSKAAVEDAAFEAGQMLRDEMEQLAINLAPELASMTEPREIELRLQGEHEKLLARLSENLARVSAGRQEQQLSDAA